MGDESFDQFVGKSHVVEDHYKIVLRSSEKVWTENNCQRFCRHVVMLLIVSDSAEAFR